MIPQLIAQHEALKAQYGKLAERRRLLDSVRTQFDSLRKLGDLVEPEDVIKAGGHLVAAGMSPRALATLMSDMPDSGPALVGWLGKHEVMAAQREEMLQPVLDSTRHQMGVAALRALVAHHLAPRGMLGQGQLQQSPGPGASLLPAQTLVEPTTSASPQSAGENA